MRKPRHLVVCDGCGCVSCECDRDNPQHDRFDNPNYDPWDRSIFGDEPTVEELLATSKAA